MRSRSLLFIDDHPIYREGLRATIEAALPAIRVEIAGDRDEALNVLAMRPLLDLCLTDERLPGASGIEIVALVRARYPATAIGILCSEPTPSLAARVRELGGVACLTKARDHDALVAAVTSLLDGSEAFDPLPPGGDVLSRRRCEIVHMAAEGLADKAISARLGVTESAVRNHWLHIFERLGATNRTEAVTKSLRRGLI